MIYLCSVSGRFPENLEIGIRAGVWGVEEKYERKIAPVREGDTLVFLLGGEFRSVHRVESDPFTDSELLWPEKDGSRFPHRVRIGPPLHIGPVPVDEVVDGISFMRDKEKWQGTVQGPNGVFNTRLTPEDLEHITARMVRPGPRAAPAPTLAEGQARVPLSFLQDQLEAAFAALLGDLGLRGAPPGLGDPLSSGEAFRLLAEDTADGAVVVLLLDPGKGAAPLLLQALRHISEVRGRLPKGRRVRALILSNHVTDELRLVVDEIPTLHVRQFRLRFALNGDPDDRGHRYGLGVA